MDGAGHSIPAWRRTSCELAATSEGLEHRSVDDRTHRNRLCLRLHRAPGALSGARDATRRRVRPAAVRARFRRCVRGEVQRVLQQLLREQVSIRDLTAILEALLETAAANKAQIALVEAARQALGRSLVQPLLGSDRKLKVLTLDPSIEMEFHRQVDPQFAPDTALAAGANPLRRVLESLQKLVGDRVALSSTVLVCNTPVRFHLRRLLEPFIPRIVVLSPAEIPSTITVQSLGVVK